MSGVYVLRLTADDSQGVSADDITITVNPKVNQAPLVNAGPDQSITLPAVATLTRTVSDDGLPSGTIAIAWSQVSGPAPVSFSVVNGTALAQFSAAGAYVLRLTATDSALSSSDDVTITVSAPAIPSITYPPPLAEITSPGDTAEITAPLNIVGTANSSILQDYQLQYRFKTDDDNGDWTTFSTATTPVQNGTLGVFDPTRLLNGIYEIRLVVTDTQGLSAVTPTVPLVVDRNLKVGNFTLSFVDLSVPVAGLPIQINRTYDSRDKRVGDFGVGWTLDIKNIRLQKNRNLGRAWEMTSTGGLLPTYCVDPVRARLVTITFPDGKVYKFQAAPAPECQFGFPLIYPRMEFAGASGHVGDAPPGVG